MNIEHQFKCPRTLVYYKMEEEFQIVDNLEYTVFWYLC